MSDDTFRIELREQKQKNPHKQWWLCLPSTGRGVRDHRGNAAFRQRQPQHRPHSAGRREGIAAAPASPHAARPPAASPARHKFPPGAAYRRGAGGRGDVDLDDHAGSGGMRSRPGGGCVREARARAGAEAGGRARGGGGRARSASLRSCHRPSPEGRKMVF